MKKCWKTVGLLACAVVLSACEVRRSVVVDAELFRQAYEAPQHATSYFKYRGQNGRDHVLDYYLMTVGSWAYYQYSWRTPVDALPREFPDTPQRWIGWDETPQETRHASDIAEVGPTPEGWRGWN